MELKLKEGEAAEELFADKIIIQNTSLYRFTSDSVLLSRFVKGKKGEVAADLCSGSGIVGLHFACLNTHIKSVTLFEMQQSLYDMSLRTIEYDGFSNASAVCCKIQDIGKEYNGRFSLVLCNPPYEKGGFENLSYEKAICRKEITVTLKEIVVAAARILKFGGRFAVINRADRAAELIYLLKSNGLEPKRMQFVCGKKEARPYLVMVEAAKGGKEGVDVLPNLVNDDSCGICGG
ncbi:MAG: methyltransferase [Clostridia bacterium]|nr:methyltransferase [Clostridia bacterium]